jgi:hypothetical protein
VIILLSSKESGNYPSIVATGSTIRKGISLVPNANIMWHLSLNLMVPACLVLIDRRSFDLSYHNMNSEQLVN